MNEAPREPARFLTVEQAAIRPLLRSGELYGFQIGGRGLWRTGLEDLQAYIDVAYLKVAEKVANGGFAEVEGGTSES